MEETESGRHYVSGWFDLVADSASSIRTGLSIISVMKRAQRDRLPFLTQSSAVSPPFLLICQSALTDTSFRLAPRMMAFEKREGMSVLVDIHLVLRVEQHPSLE